MNGDGFSLSGTNFIGYDPIALALLLVTGITASLALIVLRASRREENRVFALLAASVALWTLTNALFHTAETVGMATLWAQISYGAALSTAAAFLHFSWIYPLPPRGDSPYGLSAKTGVWLTGGLIAALAFVPGWAIQSVDIVSRRIVTGPGLFLIAAYMVGVSATAFGTFFGHQKRLRRKARAQARYVLFGSFLTALFGLTFNLAFPLAGNYRFVWVGPLASLFFVAFSGYSILAHHLFDVKLLIRRTVVYSLLLALIAGAFAALGKALELLLRPFLGGDSFSTSLLAALVVGFAVDPLKRALHRITAKALFRHEPLDEKYED